MEQGHPGVSFIKVFLAFVMHKKGTDIILILQTVDHDAPVLHIHNKGVSFMSTSSSSHSSNLIKLDMLVY